MSEANASPRACLPIDSAAIQVPSAPYPLRDGESLNPGVSESFGIGIPGRVWLARASTAPDSFPEPNVETLITGPASDRPHQHQSRGKVTAQPSTRSPKSEGQAVWARRIAIIRIRQSMRHRSGLQQNAVGSFSGLTSGNLPNTLRVTLDTFHFPDCDKGPSLNEGFLFWVAFKSNGQAINTVK
jgi:hypothetical protein